MRLRRLTVLTSVLLGLAAVGVEAAAIAQDPPPSSASPPSSAPSASTAPPTSAPASTAPPTSGPPTSGMAHAERTGTIVVVHVVRNGHPASGRVTIRSPSGHESSCEVDAEGECELSGINGGRHVVEATGPDGTASHARAVMIPEDGKVSLIVQIPDES